MGDEGSGTSYDVALENAQDLTESRHLRSVASVGKGVVAQACSTSLLDLPAGNLQQHHKCVMITRRMDAGDLRRFLSHRRCLGWYSFRTICSET